MLKSLLQMIYDGKLKRILLIWSYICIVSCITLVNLIWYFYLEPYQYYSMLFEFSDYICFSFRMYIQILIKIIP